jgi:hypothetical protein
LLVAAEAAVEAEAAEAVQFHHTYHRVPEVLHLGKDMNQYSYRKLNLLRKPDNTL